MPRYTVSVDEELAEWVETEAEQRNISRAQVIREALRMARTGQPDETQAPDVRARLGALETRVQRLESLQKDASPDLDEAEINVVDELRTYLTEHPPQSEPAKEAIITTFQLLRKDEWMTTRELREAVYAEHVEAYADAESLWQSIQRFFSQIPGIEKAGHGEWHYTGDATVLDELD